MQDEQIVQTRLCVNVYLAIENVNHKKNYPFVKLQLLCVHMNQLRKAWDCPVERTMLTSLPTPPCLKYSQPMLDLNPCICDAVPGMKKSISVAHQREPRNFSRKPGFFEMFMNL